MQQSSSDDDITGPVHAFVDAGDRQWEVREIRKPVPAERRGTFVRPEFAEGWLLFQLRHRVPATLPPGWRHASAQQFQRWVQDAMPVRDEPQA